MTNISLKVKLEGKSQLHLPSVLLEDLYPINLFSIDGGVTWRNDNVTIPLEGDLNILMSCRAISGTKWTFTVTNKETGKDLISESQRTGDPMDHRDGAIEENFSELKVNIPITIL